jgi:hypothetical protein
VNKAIRVVTITAWGFLGITRGILFVAPAAPGWLQILLWIASLGAIAWLLGVYNRRLAQWRAVLGFWAAYSCLRWLATRLPLANGPLLHDHLANLAVILVMDTLIAGYAALCLLAVRRDVSVGYIALATFLGGLALRGQVQVAGGVLNWLLGMAHVEMQEGFNLVEPLTMAGSCMITLGLLTFLPHLVWLTIREARGR